MGDVHDLPFGGDLERDPRDLLLVTTSGAVVADEIAADTANFAFSTGKTDLK